MPLECKKPCYELIASDGIAVPDQLQSLKVDRVGWSEGGIIGLEPAVEHPRRINRFYFHY
jgi:pimeloyl-ACP methyl ester carboxylesterase